jgi:hypothetical protein
MSFHEISVAVRAENRASYAFRTIAMDAVHLAYSFGALDSQTGRMLTGVMTAVHLFTSLKAVLGTTAVVQIAQTVSTNAAAAATWVLNSALAMKIALLTLGVGLIAASAAYMSWLASTTRDAASAQADYNAELARAPSPRSIRRAGEEEYYRRGVEY